MVAKLAPMERDERGDRVRFPTAHQPDWLDDDRDNDEDEDDGEDPDVLNPD